MDDAWSPLRQHNDSLLTNHSQRLMLVGDTAYLFGTRSYSLMLSVNVGYGPKTLSLTTLAYLAYV